MKQFPKILKIFFLTVFLLELIGFGLILSVGKTALAANSINLQLQSPIPGGPANIDFTNNKSTKPIADYIRVIYKYAIGIVGILATVVMMIGGIMWIMSGGSPERAGEAKAYISASLTGLVLTLCSYLILATVNPALTNFNISTIETVEEMGCCENPKATSGSTGCSQVSENQCESGWQKSGYVCSLDNKCVNNAAANLVRNSRPGCTTISLTGDSATQGQNACSLQCGSQSNINFSKSSTYQSGDGWFYCCVCDASIYSTVTSGTNCSAIYGSGWISILETSECTNAGILVQNGYSCCKLKP